MAATVAFTIVPLAACGAGFDAETDLVKPQNASVQVEDISIQSANVVVSEEGQAAVSARIFNEGGQDQTLVSITVPSSGEELELIPAEGENSLVIPAGGSIGLGGEGNPAAFAADAAAAGIAPGNAQALVFDLSESGPAELRATVVPVGSGDDAFAYYKPWGPTPAPEPEAGTETEVEVEVDSEPGDGAEPGDETETDGGPGTDATDADGTDGEGAEGDGVED